ncbi:MAG: glycosyltransferase family 2 protein [Elusimicrobia bacterium]|nr:glycosyltransferase family 2 protein [Elusimicrobiota bacterium]MBU2614755.1 glycosyltransferase family 2 protein [Elusimicrobiota bacterium]
MQIFLSIIIPAFNEETKIQKDLEKLFEYFDKQAYSFEVIVVNDGSADMTLEKVKAFGQSIYNLQIISYEKNRGKGYAVRQGVMAAKGEYIFFVDAGYCVPFIEIEKGLNLLKEGNDIALGSRLLKESNIVIKQPFYRTIAGRTFSFLVKSFIGLKGIKDTQCGFKLFTGKCAKAVFAKQKIDGFTFDAEVLLISRRAGYKIAEFPIQWACDLDSKIKPMSHTLKILAEIIRIRLTKP